MGSQRDHIYYDFTVFQSIHLLNSFTKQVSCNKINRYAKNAVVYQASNKLLFFLIYKNKKKVYKSVKYI